MKCKNDFYDCSKIADQLCFESKGCLAKEYRMYDKKQKASYEVFIQTSDFGGLMFYCTSERQEDLGYIFSFAQYISHKLLSLSCTEIRYPDFGCLMFYTTYLRKRIRGYIFICTQVTGDRYLSQAQLLAPDGMDRMPLAADS